MWSGIFPAVTTKFTEDDRLDHAQMERCFALQVDGGCDGIVACGSLGEGPMLSIDEQFEVLRTTRKIAGGRAPQGGGKDRQGRACRAPDIAELVEGGVVPQP